MNGIQVKTVSAGGEVLVNQSFPAGVSLKCQHGGETYDAGTDPWTAPEWTRLWIETPGDCLGPFTPATGGTLEIAYEEAI